MEKDENGASNEATLQLIDEINGSCISLFQEKYGAYEQVFKNADEMTIIRRMHQNLIEAKELEKVHQTESATYARKFRKSINECVIALLQLEFPGDLSNILTEEKIKKNHNLHLKEAKERMVTKFQPRWRIWRLIPIGSMSGMGISRVNTLWQAFRDKSYVDMDAMLKTDTLKNHYYDTINFCTFMLVRLAERKTIEA